MMNNNIVRQRIETHQSKLAEEREWWDRKKANIKDGFMKELDAEGSSTTTKTEPPRPSSSSGANATTDNTTGPSCAQTASAPSATS